MAKKRVPPDQIDLLFSGAENRPGHLPDFERIGTAYEPEAFEIVRQNKLNYPPREAWESAGGVTNEKPPRYPTRAKYWERYDIGRLRDVTPLPGEPRSRAAKRAAMARSFTGRVREYEKRSGEYLWWRVEVNGELRAITDSAKGVQPVSQLEHASPWFRVPRDVPPTNDQIRAVYLDVIRSMVRASTGFGKGAKKDKTTDGRHGPAWANERAPTSSQPLNDLRRNGITYENSSVYPSSMRVVIRTVAPGRAVS